MILLVVLSALVLMAAATCLNALFGRSARQVVRDQFNEEQLVVARNIKYWIENRLEFLARELISAAERLEGVGGDASASCTALQPCFDRVMELGVGEIELQDRVRKRIHSFYPSRRQISTRPYEEIATEEGLGNSSTEAVVSVSRPYVEGSDIFLLLSIVPKHAEFDRLSFRLNMSWFLSPFLKNIRSGKTGYAWLIDAQGRFLFHPQSDFIGRSAFEARQIREPGISYARINAIQRDRMLRGMEGAGAYHSTWHRGITGKIEKLIAYCPVAVSSTPAQNWSVAVVAPLFEIEDALRKIHLWQGVLQGLVVLVIAAGSGMLLWLEVKWSRRLEKTVADRTLALKRSEEKYRSLVESAEEFIFTLDEAGCLISVNHFTAASFGSTPEKLAGCGVDHLFPRGVADRQIRIVRTVFEKGKSVRDEFELVVGNSEIWLSANFMPLKNEAGRMDAVLCIARDITENKKLEHFLITTEKLASLGTLAAGVAHEINNPLGVMLGFCDLLVRKKEPGSQEYEDLKIIERQGLHCKQIVENLLSFARVGKETAADSDINGCLEEILQVVRHSLEMNAIHLDIDLAENLPRVVGDDRQLQQVFLNLINNAAAAMPRGGALKIRTSLSVPEKKVRIEIEDRGSGIGPESLDHIFEPFFTTKPEGEGTGLGLFVSYGILHKFGGGITCDSRTQDMPDKPMGTTFVVTLPICR
jgi:PAS domain S-box-containing protein